MPLTLWKSLETLTYHRRVCVVDSLEVFGDIDSLEVCEQLPITGECVSLTLRKSVGTLTYEESVCY